MKVTFIKDNIAGNRVLRPYDEESADIFTKISEFGLVVFNLQKNRNPKFHRLAFAMMRHLYDMVEEDMPFDNWRKLMLIKAGYFTSVGKVDVRGTVSSALIPDSMAYEKMDEVEFKKCINNFLQQFIIKYEKSMTYEQLSEAASSL